MNALEKALFDTHGAILEKGDVVKFEYNYCSSAIVDVIVIDGSTKKETVFPAFDAELGVFPYDNDPE
jgi:hypothetical protein